MYVHKNSFIQNIKNPSLRLTSYELIAIIGMAQQRRY